MQSRRMITGFEAIAEAKNSITNKPLYGMPIEHMRAFKSSAEELQSVVMVRGVNPGGTQHIKAGYYTKDMAIHMKSHPIFGLIEAVPGTEDLKTALDAGYTTAPLVMTRQVFEAYKAQGSIITGERKGSDIPFILRERDSTGKVTKETKMIARTDQDAYSILYSDDKPFQLVTKRGRVAKKDREQKTEEQIDEEFESKLKQIEDNKKLTPEQKKEQIQKIEEYRSQQQQQLIQYGYLVEDYEEETPIAPDYDLFGVAPELKQLAPGGKHKTRIHTQGGKEKELKARIKQSEASTSSADKEDPDRGNVSENIIEALPVFNKHIRAVDPKRRLNNALVHHNMDITNPYSKPTYPIFVVFPKAIKLEIEKESESYEVIGEEVNKILAEAEVLGQTVTSLLIQNENELHAIYHIIRDKGYYLPQHVHYKAFNYIGQMASKLDVKMGSTASPASLDPAVLEHIEKAKLKRMLEQEQKEREMLERKKQEAENPSKSKPKPERRRAMSFNAEDDEAEHMVGAAREATTPGQMEKKEVKKEPAQNVSGLPAASASSSSLLSAGSSGGTPSVSPEELALSSQSSSPGESVGGHHEEDVPGLEEVDEHRGDKKKSKAESSLLGGLWKKATLPEEIIKDKELKISPEQIVAINKHSETCKLIQTLVNMRNDSGSTTDAEYKKAYKEYTDKVTRKLSKAKEPEKSLLAPALKAIVNKYDPTKLKAEGIVFKR